MNTTAVAGCDGGGNHTDRQLAVGDVVHSAARHRWCRYDTTGVGRDGVLGVLLDGRSTCSRQELPRSAGAQVVTRISARRLPAFPMPPLGGDATGRSPSTRRYFVPACPRMRFTVPAWHTSPIAASSSCIGFVGEDMVPVRMPDMGVNEALDGAQAYLQHERHARLADGAGRGRRYFAGGTPGAAPSRACSRCFNENGFALVLVTLNGT